MKHEPSSSCLNGADGAGANRVGRSDAVYLLDTNIISELRRRHPHRAVVAWLETIDDADLHLSAVTVGEIQAGIEITREQDPEKAAEIEAWLDEVIATRNVLDMDARTFRLWARLMHRRSDHLIEDAMIAATAAVHHLAIVSRNARDFEGLGIRVVNPFEFRPG